MFTQEDVIYSYTRKQAVDDGFQIKLDGKLESLVKEAGFKYPVFITSSLWNVIERAVANKRHLNDLDGVLWDIFSVLKWAIKRNGTRDTIWFTVKITGAGRKQNFQLVAQIGATDIDDPRPAFTIMLPEDL